MRTNVGVFVFVALLAIGADGVGAATPPLVKGTVNGATINPRGATSITGGSSTSGTEEKAQTEKKEQTETAKDRAQATKDAIGKALNQSNEINRSTESVGR